MSAVEALGKISSDKVIEPLIQALKDLDDFVLRIAVEALGKIGNDKAVEPLIQTFKNKNPYVRRRVVEALGKIGSDKAVEPLIEALKDLDDDVRRRVVEVLGKIGSDKAVEPLIQALKDLDDDDDDVRRRVVEVLGKIGSDKAVEPLIQAFKDSDNYVRMSAAVSLCEIAKADRNLPTLTQQLPHLLTLIPTEASQQALSVITSIQARCKYYNYDIAQTPLPPEDNPNPTTGSTYIFKAPVGQVVENLTVQRDNIATQNNQKTAPES